MRQHLIHRFAFQGRFPGIPPALAVFLFFAAGPLATQRGACLAADDLPITIGLSAPLTGGSAAYGKDEVNGVQMAVDELNARAMVIGGRKVVWRIEQQDDQGDPRQATAVVQQFVDRKVNLVVGPLNSGCVFPASRVLANAGVPQLVVASDPRVTRQGFSTVFRTIGDDGVVARALAGYAQRALDVRRVAVIDDRTAYGQGQADLFVAEAKRLGLKVEAREYTSDKATDFRAILTRIKPIGVDAIFFGGVYSQAGPLLRQAQQLGMPARLLGGDTLCVTALAEMAGSAVDKVVCAEGGQPLAASPEGKAWRARYDARFGARAYQVYGPYFYDGVMAVAAAMEKAQSVDPARYLPLLRDTHHAGVTRRDMHFTAAGDLADPVVTFSRFEGGVKTPITTTPVR